MIYLINSTNNFYNTLDNLKISDHINIKYGYDGPVVINTKYINNIRLYGPYLYEKYIDQKYEIEMHLIQRLL